MDLLSETNLCCIYLNRIQYFVFPRATVYLFIWGGVIDSSLFLCYLMEHAEEAVSSGKVHREEIMKAGMRERLPWGIS